MISFLLNNTMLGVGLAMDAFSVSMANGLSEPRMKKTKMYGMSFCSISGSNAFSWMAVRAYHCAVFYSF